MRMEKTVEASAWREPVNDDGFFYRLQVNNVSSRSVRQIEKACASWHPAGYGWHPETKYKILIYAKKFDSKEQWLDWAKQFPFKLVELNNKGNPKPIKLGIDCNKKRK